MNSNPPKTGGLLCSDSSFKVGGRRRKILQRWLWAQAWGEKLLQNVSVMHNQSPGLAVCGDCAKGIQGRHCCSYLTKARGTQWQSWNRHLIVTVRDPHVLPMSSELCHQSVDRPSVCTPESALHTSTLSLGL